MTQKLSFDEVLELLVQQESSPHYDVLVKWQDRYPEYKKELAQYFARGGSRIVTRLHPSSTKIGSPPPSRNGRWRCFAGKDESFLKRRSIPYRGSTSLCLRRCTCCTAKAMSQVSQRKSARCPGRRVCTDSHVSRAHHDERTLRGGFVGARYGNRA